MTILYLHTLKHTHKIIASNTRLCVLFYSNTLWNPGFRGIMHLHNKKRGKSKGAPGSDNVANSCRKFPKDLSNPDALRTEIDQNHPE